MQAQLLTLCSNSVIYLWECPEREEKGQSESKLPHIIGQLEFASAQNSKYDTNCLVIKLPLTM